jgi:hypothetical protein
VRSLKSESLNFPEAAMSSIMNTSSVTWLFVKPFTSMEAKSETIFDAETVETEKLVVPVLSLDDTEVPGALLGAGETLTLGVLGATDTLEPILGLMTATCPATTGEWARATAISVKCSRFGLSITDLLFLASIQG